MVYLLLGQDASSKDIKLKAIKQEFISKDYQQFNCDTLYAKELDLSGLQEKILTLPFKSKKRVIVIKNAHALKSNIKEFIIRYVKNPLEHLVMILDLETIDTKDEFVRDIRGACQLFRFKDNPKVDTFVLSRQIEAKRIESALKVLNQLFQDGEKPERILGGLRYSWERYDSIETKRRLKALLDCDIDVKTGRLKPEFALEKLVIRLCK